MTGAPPPPSGDGSPPGPRAGAVPDPGPADAPPPPPPGNAAEPPPPIGGGGRRFSTRLIVVVAIIALLVVGGVVKLAGGQNARYTVVTSSSTDGTFNAGDCVSLSSTRVTRSTCSGAHDAQIIRVVHGHETCPGGTTEFDVNDGTGNLCLDEGNHSKG